MSFFFHQFVTAVSMLERHPPQLEESPLLNMILLHPLVRDAAVSVGLAARSNVTRDRSMHLVAREKYVAAINSVRMAVEKPELANPDQTFKLIVMLSLYEVRPSCNFLPPPPPPPPPLYFRTNRLPLDG